MTHVRLIGPSDDGQHLVLLSDDGHEFTLAVTDQLRSAVRHARGAVQATEEASGDEPAMSPKEIQQRIRGGLNAAELAELTHMSVEALEKYEAPVLAERDYVAQLARSTRIGRDESSPILGDLVTDRLVGRGVDPEDLEWDAWRAEGEPWNLCVDYPIDGRTVRAQWAFDHTARAVTALDDEARWLTETELLDVPIPKRHLSSVASEGEASNVRPLHESRPPLPGVPEREPDEDSAPNSTELLLANLEARRGTRDVMDIDADEDETSDFEGFGPTSAPREADVGFTADPPEPMPHPAGSARTQDDTPETPSVATPASGTKKPVKKGRASVPSWDEIVFGAKND